MANRPAPANRNKKSMPKMNNVFAKKAGKASNMSRSKAVKNFLLKNSGGM